MGRPTKVKLAQEAAPLGLHQLPGHLLTKEDIEGEQWHECFPSWPEHAAGGHRASLEEWRAVAVEALANASRAYEKQAGGKSGGTERALSKEKTVGDRIASVTLMVQESPLHRLDELRLLLGFAQKKGRRERSPAMEALKDLFINDLLPSDRRLVKFDDRDFECGKQSITKRHVAYALFEDELKSIYREFLAVLEESGRDTLAHFKQKAVKVILELLAAKPESEKELLSMLVNKLGDPDRKVSSIASYSLSQLIEKHHPQMRLIVVREVEQLLTRPNVTRRTQYFAISFLNQIRFSNDDVELARKTLRIYMDLFTSCLEGDKAVPKRKKIENPKTKKRLKRKRKARAGKTAAPSKPIVSTEAKDSRLMGALLIGANRAYPFTKPEQDATSYQKYYDALFSVAHAQSLAPATHALAFLLQVSQSTSTQSDRFYRALYSRVYDVAEAGEPKQAAFLNLIYKALSADTDPRRVKAFLKRLLQAATYGSSAFAGACIVVVSECFKGRQLGSLKAFISLAEGDDAEEVFVDVDKSDDEVIEDGETQDVDISLAAAEQKAAADEAPQVAGSRVGLVGTGATAGEAGEGPKRYNPNKREPQFAGAERSSLWELVSLCSHFHPSVSTFGKTMCFNMSNVRYGGDPLKDFSLISFLDKFVYKKPKNRVAKSLYGKRSARYRDNPVANSPEFQTLAEDGDIGEDEKFFARYFHSNPNRVVSVDESGDPPTKRGDGSETGEESEEEAFEQAMHAEMRRLGADPGFVVAGRSGSVPDVDEEDNDEMKAFDKAFGMETAEGEGDEGERDSIDGDEEGGDSQVVPLGAFESGDEDDADKALLNGKASSDEESEPPFKKSKKRKGKPAVQSAFAAMEDYAEAIDAEARAAEEGAHSPADDEDADDLEHKLKVRPARKKRAKRKR